MSRQTDRQQKDRQTNGQSARKADISSACDSVIEGACMSWEGQVGAGGQGGLVTSMDKC